MTQLVYLLWELASARVKRRVAFFTILNFGLAVLDIVALFVFAKIFTSIVNQDTSFMSELLITLKLEQYLDQSKSIYSVSILFVVFLLSTKSIMSLVVGKRVLNTLSQSYQSACENLTKKYFDMEFSSITARPTYEVFLAVNNGVRDLYITGIYSMMIGIVEIGIVALIFGVILFNGGIPSLMLALFLILSFTIISKATGGRIKRHSEKLVRSNLDSAVVIQTIIESVRETRVFNSIGHFLQKQRISVSSSAEASVALQFIGYLPKIIMESTFLIGIALFTLFLILTGNINTAVAELGFIVAMGSRIIPSLLRLQFSLNQLKQVRGSSIFTRELLQLPEFNHARSWEETGKVQHRDASEPFDGSLSVKNVSYSYPGAPSAALLKVSFDVNPGGSVGIVGRSGSGKSTLLDLLCGVSIPSDGLISVSGVPIREGLVSWRGRVGFVPQQIPIIDGTLRENLLLGRDEALFASSDFDRALQFANLSNMALNEDKLLDYRLTRAGSELSGGQKQKLGIARALLAKPDILILDEVTSSLDVESERNICESIKLLEGKVTLVVVAHRLNTVKDLQKIVLLEDGEIVASGPYQFLVENSQAFNSFVSYSSR
jgi:ABC-type multidrug transport system fused ATPase/permease subunit